MEVNHDSVPVNTGLVLVVGVGDDALGTCFFFFNDIVYKLGECLEELVFCLI